MSIKEDLITKINSGKIKFDPGANNLKEQLLRENSGQLITESLQKLILFLSQNVTSHIRISSLFRHEGYHGEGRAVDIGNEEIATEILPIISGDLNVQLYNIDELIFDAGGSTAAERNRFNYDQGSRHIYDEATLADHRDHIHFSVKSLKNLAKSISS